MTQDSSQDEGGAARRLMEEATLPSTGFVRLTVVLQHIQVGKTKWWAGVASGDYPKPVKHRKLGNRGAHWRAEDIRALIREINEAA
jgi:predicted DNA-binding transcriptional regulator AlpA